MGGQGPASSGEVSNGCLKGKHSFNDRDSYDTESNDQERIEYGGGKRKRTKPADRSEVSSIQMGIDNFRSAAVAKPDKSWVHAQDSEPEDAGSAEIVSVNYGSIDSVNNSGKSTSSDDDNWQDSITGIPKRRMRRKDVVWPVYYSQSDYSHRCCDTCKAMTGTADGLRGLLDPRGYKHLNWYDLQETASQGCVLCQTIWDITEHADWDYDRSSGWVVHDEIRVTANFTQQMDVDAARRSLKCHPLEGRLLDGIDFHIPDDSRDHRPPYAEGEVWNLVTFDADPAANIVPGRRECKDLTSQAAAKIRQWLDECQDKHHSCPSRSDHPLPRRVIDLASPMLRLYESGPSEKGPYAALSYCWGGVTQLTTTAANYQDHLQSIDARSLPKTIVDAIEVCRAIGLRYLWVDALCIVQDDDSDKLNQIANMGSIYKESLLTIMAASAQKVTDGFLGDGKPVAPDTQLPLYVDEATTGTVYFRQKDGAQTYLSEEPIFHRGWTYQELLLSPRAVIFDSNQIMLKCLTDSYRPLFETYLDVEVGAPDMPVSVFGMVDTNLASRSTRGSREFYLEGTQNRIWRAIVHDYSARELSTFDDRMLALSGIATELAAAWDDTYLAGFWQRTVLKHLNWCGAYTAPQKELFEGVDHTRRTKGPTWSWTTVPYPVEIKDLDKPDPQLVGSDIQLVSQNSPFGQVWSASIVLRARVLDMAAALGSDVAFRAWPATSYMRNGILLDFEEPKPEINRCRLVYLGMAHSDATFLVVEQTGAGEYRRIGHVSLTDNSYFLSTKETCVWADLLKAAQREVITLQ